MLAQNAVQVFRSPHVSVGTGVLFLMHRAYERMRLSMDTCRGFIFLFVF